MLMFLHAVLPPLINLILILRCFVYDVLFICVKLLSSRFVSLELVRKFSNDNLTTVEIKGRVFKDENILDTSKMFVGFLLRSKSNELLDKGDSSDRDFDIFYKPVVEFHSIAFIYTINNFPLKDELLQHTQFVNFYDQKCTF